MLIVSSVWELSVRVLKCVLSGLNFICPVGGVPDEKVYLLWCPCKTRLCSLLQREPDVVLNRGLLSMSKHDDMPYYTAV